MPGAKRQLDPGLIDQLRDEPYRFEFFQAVRVLLAQYRKQDGGGQDLDLLGQLIRFRNSVSLGFPPSEIEGLQFEPLQEDRIEDEGRQSRNIGKVTLTPSFFGLTGPQGVMPRHYTQYVAEREFHHRDSATRAFLDIFASRAVALFYQTWLKYRLHLQYEADRKNHFLPLVLSVAGFGLPGLQGRLASDGEGIADESLAYYAGVLRERPQSVHSFARVVADYFGVGCEAEQFVGQWFELPRQELTTLGKANCRLGESTLCGARIWDRASRIRLRIGPLRKKQFTEFLPGRRASVSMVRLFGLMLGPAYDCEIRLILDRRDLAHASIDTRQRQTALGWNGWLGGRTPSAHSEEVAYLIHQKTMEYQSLNRN